MLTKEQYSVSYKLMLFIYFQSFAIVLLLFLEVRMDDEYSKVATYEDCCNCFIIYVIRLIVCM